MKPSKRVRFRFLTFAAAIGIVALISGMSGCGGGKSGYKDPNAPRYDTPTTATYKTARCTDGSYTYSKQPEIFCASRGGIDQRYDRPN